MSLLLQLRQVSLASQMLMCDSLDDSFSGTLLPVVYLDMGRHLERTLPNGCCSRHQCVGIVWLTSRTVACCC